MKCDETYPGHIGVCVELTKVMTFSTIVHFQNIGSTAVSKKVQMEQIKEILFLSILFLRTFCEFLLCVVRLHAIYSMIMRS